MPNGDYSPMTEDESADFFYSLGVPPETDDGPQPCAPLWRLGQALRGGLIPEVIDDAFGLWGALMREVFNQDELQPLSLEGNEAVVSRLIEAGLDRRLALGLLSPWRVALAHLLSDDEIHTQSWPNWDELRLRATRKPWPVETIEEVFFDAGNAGS